MTGPIVRSSNLAFFRAREAEARANAEAATLVNVRERCRRSEEAWSALAHKAEKSEKLRVAEAQRKAEQSLAE